MTEEPTDEGEVILEPGDPGYVPPEGAEPVPADQGGPIALEPAPPGRDLQHERNPRESDAEFLARTRHVAVESTSPTDIVPNTPQITMGTPEMPPGGLPEEIADQAGHPDLEQAEPVPQSQVGEPVADPAQEPAP